MKVGSVQRGVDLDSQLESVERTQERETTSRQTEEDRKVPGLRGIRLLNKSTSLSKTVLAWSTITVILNINIMTKIISINMPISLLLGVVAPKYP